MNGDNFLTRLVAVFIAPGKAMEGVKERPLWLPVSLILAITIGLFSGWTAHISGPEQLETMRDSRIGQMMTEEDYAKSYNEALDPTMNKRLLNGVGGGFFVWVLSLVFGLVLMLASKLSGGTSRFSQILGVIFWASVIQSAGVLLKIPLVFAKESIAEATLSGAALLPEADVTSGLYVFLSQFTEIFTLWALVVTIIGIMKINDFSGGKASIVVLVPWVLFTGLGFLITMLFM